MLAHAQALLDHTRDVQLTSPPLSPLSQLLSRIGGYLWGRGLDRRLARELHEQALAMRQRLYEGDHPDVATSLIVLASDLRALGDYARARERDEQALEMRQRLFEGDHPDVADSLSNLAIDLHALGEHARARELDEHASAMRQRLTEPRLAPGS